MDSFTIKSKKINKIFRQYISEKVRKINLADGKSIICTMNHKFLSENNMWVSSLKENDRVYVTKNSDLELTAVASIEYFVYQGFVYDIEVPY